MTLRLVPLSLALARYAAALPASGRPTLDGPSAHGAASDRDQEDGNQDSDRSLHHTASMAMGPGSDHPIRTNRRLGVNS